MPVKKGGTAMHSWLTVVRPASRTPPALRADHTPRGTDTATISTKLKRLRVSVSTTLEAIRSHTG